MPRWIIIFDSSLSCKKIYFPFLPTSMIFLLMIFFSLVLFTGTLKLEFLTSIFLIILFFKKGSTPLLVVSTSGNSGT